MNLRAQEVCALRKLRRENRDENRGFVWRSGAGTPAGRLRNACLALYER
jgi:hypothetical protein